MIKQSDLALAAWKATERTLDAVVTINKIDYKTTDIASISYDAGGYTGDTFGIGSNYENSVTIKFSHLIEGLKPGMTVWPKIGIKTSNGYEYSSLGLFIVSDDIQMDRNNDETTIKAYDQMCLLEGTYTSKLTYPAKMTSVIAEIANLAGVLLNTTDISRLPVQVNLPSAITGQTYRNAIGMIAQFYAGFATFDRDGKLTIRTITEPDYTLDPSQYEQGGLTKNEAPYKIGGIQCEVTTTTTDSTGQSTETTNTLQVGATSGSQIKLTNNLMTMDRLASIWQQLQSLTFYPFSLNWFGNPAIEAGDWLTLQDTKSNKFNVPNNGYTMTFDGSLSAVSKADQASTSSSSYAWRGELSQYVADLGGRQGASGNYIYGTDTTEPPYGAKFNDIWYKQNGNKIELWTYERQADGTGKWVLTVSDSTGEEVKAKVDQVELEAKASTDAAKAASDKADQLSAKYDDTNALANQALGQAVSAQGDASSAVAAANSTASEFGPVKQSADSALASALNAQNAASDAVAKANSTASGFGKVEESASNALSSALNAQSNASAAVSQASSAAADSKDAKQIAGAVSQSYKTLTDGSTMTIAELQNGLAAKLTKSDLDGYATQTWTQNQIKVTADGINGTVSSIKSTVDGQTTSINDLKADSSGFKAQFQTVNDTLGKQTTDIGSMQATSKELTTGFNTLTSDNTTNKNDISQLKQTATEVSSTLETVQTQVKDSAVGTNLIIQSDLKYGCIFPDGSLGSNTVDFHSDNYIPTNGATVFTFSSPDYAFKGNGNDDRIAMYDSDKNYLGYQSLDSPTQTLSQSNVAYIRFSINSADEGNTTGNSSDWLANHRYKLEKGSVATDWCPNPADNATVTAFSQLSQTVDSIQTDMSKKIEQKDLNGYATQAWTQNQIKITADGINATLSSVKSTVDGQTTSINDLKADSSSFKSQFTTVNNTIGKQSTDISTLQATSKELTTGFNTLTTDNKTNTNDISQLKQTSTEISSTLETVKTQVQNSAVGTNLLLSTGDLSANWGFNGTVDTSQKPAVLHYPMNSLTSGNYVIAQQSLNDGLLQPSTTYTASFYAKGEGTFAFYCYPAVSEGGGDNHTNIKLTSDYKLYTKTFTTDHNISGGKALLLRQDYSPSATDQNTVEVYVYGLKLEKGSLATDWCPNPADNATVTAVSKLSQTVDGMKADISKKIEQKDLNGYATQDWTQNKIKLTADGINGTLSSVKSTVDSHTTSINELKADSSGFKAQFTKVTGTLGKQTTDIGAVQASTKSLSASFDSLSRENNTNKHDISQLQATAKSFSSTLVTVQTQVKNSAVGTNLLTNTSDLKANWTLDSRTIVDTSQTPAILHYPKTTLTSSGASIIANQQLNDGLLQPSTTYTASFYAKGTGTFRFYCYPGVAEGASDTITLIKLTSEYKLYTITFTTVSNLSGNKNLLLRQDYTPSDTDENTVEAYIYGLKLEKGSIATDWCTNPADNATVTAVSSISQTVNAIQTTVRGKVDNDVYQSKMTQLSGQITSVVGQVNTFGIRNFVTNSQFQYDYLDGASWTGGTTDTWYKDDFAWSRVNGYQGICINQPIGTDSWPSLDSRKIVIGQDISTPWSASAYVNVDTVGVNAIFGIGFFDTKGVRIGFKESYKTSHGLELMKVENAVPPAGTETVDIYFIAHGGGHVAMICPMLNQGTTAAAYVPDNASWSEFQQTASDINLKVSKNGVINAVNVSTEGIQIYGDKLHITATTYIDDAIIKDAMIESINAEKIKVGTLDATKVNIIKLNANNITTGTINGSNLSINLNTGNVEFQAGRIHSSDNTIDININSGYMSVANGSNRVMLKDGEMQFVEPGTYDTSSNPYLRISNTFGGQSTEGAAFIGRKYAVLANSDNLTGSGIFDITMGTETFSGFATGYGSGFLNKGWHMTKIGGADRGVVISGGKATSYRQYWSASPSIMVGATQTSTNSGGMYGSNIIMDCNYLYNFSTWVRTSSHAANVYVADDGAIVRASSASKYKTNIERSFDTGMGERILEIPTAHWFDKAEVRKKTLDPQAPDPRRYFGMIADDLDDAGLTELVEYDEKGEVEGIMYDRVALTIIPIVRNYRDRITKLESEVKQLKEG
ncbi:gp58-like family protein [Lactiplantibacillus plantarum]|uniref:gp58-like family protein n=1 Tax=Lactiplantibacillus plantarum TaxID=1590 RepID=UPI00311E46E3